MVGQHYFSGPGRPTFEQIDEQGNVLGRIVGQSFVSVPRVRQQDDGGFGSVPELLLRAIEGSGETRCCLSAHAPPMLIRIMEP